MNDIPLSSDMFYAWQHSSVLKGPLFLPVYYSNLLAVFNKNEHKEVIHLAGRNKDLIILEKEIHLRTAITGCITSLSISNPDSLLPLWAGAGSGSRHCWES